MCAIIPRMSIPAEEAQQTFYQTRGEMRRKEEKRGEEVGAGPAAWADIH